MNGIQLTAIISASTYFTNKLVNYCCTPVANPRSPPRFIESLKNQGHKISKWCEATFGTRVWSLVSDIIVDNAWISVIALSIILRAPYCPLPIDNQLLNAVIIAGCGVVLSITAWATRALLTISLPFVYELTIGVICPKKFGRFEVNEEDAFDPPGLGGMPMGDPTLQPDTSSL